MKKKYWIAGSVAAVLLIAGIVIFLILSQREQMPAVPASDNKVPTKTAKVDSPPLPAKTPIQKPNAQTLPSVSPQPSDADEAAVYEYPIELEEKFIEEAMETIPKLVEVDVHEPGVVFFRHQPDRPENMEAAMNDLADLYKTRLKYNEPVNVVFFISGRPIKSKVFFRE